MSLFERNSLMQYDISKPVENPEKLLDDPQSIILVDLVSPAAELYVKYSEYLKPNPEGIYRRRKINPVICKDSQVFLQTGMKQIPYEEVLNAQDDIISVSGKTLISKRELSERKMCLSTKGFYSISAMNILKCHITNMMDEMVDYCIPFTIETDFTKYLNPEKEDAEQVITPDLVETILGDKGRSISDWCTGKEWHIHRIVDKGMEIWIERLVDFRIYDWTVAMYEKQNPSKDE